MVTIVPHHLSEWRVVTCWSDDLQRDVVTRHGPLTKIHANALHRLAHSSASAPDCPSDLTAPGGVHVGSLGASRRSYGGDGSAASRDDTNEREVLGRGVEGHPVRPEPGPELPAERGDDQARAFRGRTDVARVGQRQYSSTTRFLLGLA